MLFSCCAVIPSKTCIPRVRSMLLKRASHTAEQQSQQGVQLSSSYEQQRQMLAGADGTTQQTDNDIKKLPGYQETWTMHTPATCALLTWRECVPPDLCFRGGLPWEPHVR
jgi:hypothetical protein